MKFGTSTLAAVALSGLSILAAGLASGSTPVDVNPADLEVSASLTPADRIEAAFTISVRAEAAPPVAAIAPKGNLRVKAGCAGQYWPYIEAGCLVVADGRANPPGRTVTIGEQVSVSETVLIRLPAPQFASR